MARDLRIRGYTVLQAPNPPLWIALGALLVSRITDNPGSVHNLARAVFYVALTVWAYEEVAEGVNGLRKALGAIALVWIVVSISSALAH